MSSTISIYVPEIIKAKFLTKFSEEERREIRKEASEILVKRIDQKAD